MARPVVHFEIGVADGDRSRTFYRELFDWAYETEPDQPNTLVVFDEGIGGNLMQVPEGVAPYVTFYVHVEDLQTYLDEAERLGGRTTVPPMPIPGVGSLAMFADPDENMIGLFREEQEGTED